MNKQNLQIGVIAVAAVLLLIAIIVAKPGPLKQQDAPAVAETATAKSTTSQKQVAAETATAKSTTSQKQVAAETATAATTTSQKQAVADKATTTNDTSQNPAVASPASGKTTPAAALAKAVFDVEGMSCSGCINEIKGSLAEIEGVGNVLVDLDAGKVEVYYDADKLKDVGRIASAITAVGYPATLKQTLTKEEVANQNSYLTTRSKLYIAAVGDWEISRSDYATELAHAKSRYEKIYGNSVFSSSKGSALLQSLQSQVVSRLISEGIQMQEIRKSGYKLPPGAVQTAFNDFLAEKGMTEEAFNTALKDSNYGASYFKKKFENRVTIDRYVKENVITEVSNEVERQQEYIGWYNNARLMADVVFYDKDLEAAMSSSSKSSSCGSNSKSSSCGGDCTKQ